ncbi:MAG TPA: 2TM domain-containing protein [Candidatus Kapabacteria bacterium]|jgi:hypothetical protein|nr:2TM domain-containing protein [Candidatus Kapabacteria bacterium]
MKIQATTMDTANQPQPRKYSQDEVSAILRRALERQGTTSGITHDELIETARELGIDPTALESAISEQRTVGEYETARSEYLIHRRQKFYEHLRSYLIVNFVLLVLDMVVTEGTWFFWPLLGWGIGVAFDAADTFWPKEKDIDRGARRVMEKRARQEAELRKLERKNAPKQFTFEARDGKIVIEKGDKRIEIG